MPPRSCSSRVFVPLLLTPDGVAHILRNRADPAYCGEDTGERVAPTWVPRARCCLRCLQHYLKDMGEVTAWRA